MTGHANDFESASVEEAAAAWFVRRRDGLSAEAEADYQAWVRADPRHAAAMARYRDTWETVSFPARAGRSRDAARALDRRENSRRRRPFVVAAAGLAAAALIVAFIPKGTPPKADATIIAVAARPNLQTLPDGSTIELNAGAEIETRFTPERRSVQLIRGEAFFSVAKDAARPFVVSAGDVEVRAVGTAFAVRSATGGVGVLVTEGRVAVDHGASVAPTPVETGGATPTPPPLYLDAGREVVVGHDRSHGSQPQVRPLSTVEMEAALAWRDRRVEFSRMALSEVVALFNARNRVKLAISDRATATIPISGIFWSDDPEGFVRLLESGLAVRAERSGDTIVLSKR